MSSNISKLYKKQKRRKKLRVVRSILMTIIVIIGSVGGITYLSDRSDISEEYEPKYSQIELYTFTVDYIKSNFKEMKVSDYVITDYFDENNNIEITTKYFLNDNHVESDLHLSYINNSFIVKDGVVIYSIEDKEEVEVEQFELPGTEINSEEKEKVLLFIKNYLGAINSGTAEQFDDNVKALNENSYYDVEKVTIQKATRDTLIYTTFKVDYVITTIDGQEIYRQSYNYNLSYNEDTQKIEEKIY